MSKGISLFRLSASTLTCFTVLIELRPDWEADAQPVKEESEIEISAVRVQTPRAWMPIDNFNKAFVDSLEQRKEKMLSHDFVKGNVVRIAFVAICYIKWMIFC